MLFMTTKGISTTEKEKGVKEEIKAVGWPNLLMGGRGERKERRVLDQDASGCGYFLCSKQLAGCTEYGMTHNVEGAPREGERMHRGGEPPALPGLWL